MYNTFMDNYWENRFVKEKILWGIKPSNIVINCEKIFKENNVKNVLIMGIGYGRNGKYFIENGYNVDGIELSNEAIKIGKEFCPKINFINGSVLNIDLEKKYDAIFCYSIIHLFQKSDRQKILENCIKYCKDNGLIAISNCSTKDKTYKIGNKIEENTYEIKEGKIIHFFDEEEMKSMDKELEIIKIDLSEEIIETEKRKEKYNMIYGIYKNAKTAYNKR